MLWCPISSLSEQNICEMAFINQAEVVVVKFYTYIGDQNEKDGIKCSSASAWTVLTLLLTQMEILGRLMFIDINGTQYHS